MSVFSLGRRNVRVQPSMAIGKGGEADVYDIGGDKALKVYKLPTHPDFDGFPLEQEAARQRLAERQTKLPSFPSALPARVIVPEELARDQKTGMIAGFSMRLLKGADIIARLREHGFRTQVTGNTVIEIFRDLHETVKALHRKGVVIGDFNDLNVLIIGNQAFVIDADSFQFGPYFCGTFTQRFADPLLCDPAEKHLMLVRPHTINSDWYAFAALLLQSLVRVDPYGGVYRPQDGVQIPWAARPLHRISVFHPHVGYPKNALPIGMLTDELAQYLHTVFMQDVRGEFPLGILENVRWTQCTVCGVEHARGVCPNCAVPAPAIKEKVRGNVRARRVFKTSGNIVYAHYQNGTLLYLYHHKGALKREDGRTVFQGDVKPHMRFRLIGDDTLVGQDNIVLRFSKSQPTNPQKHVVDTFGTKPMFDTDADRLLTVQSGRMLFENAGSEFIGSVLRNQTVFWGAHGFGFGFYRAGELFRAFVFEQRRHGLNDNVVLPRIRGQMVDMTAVLSDRQIWFFTTRRENRKVINQCTAISRTGEILASAEAEDGDGSWLGSLRGKCAVGTFLLAATDSGIVRIDVNGNNLVVTKEFPDTKGFVHSGNHIVAGDGGLYAIGGNEIIHITIS